MNENIVNVRFSITMIYVLPFIVGIFIKESKIMKLASSRWTVAALQHMEPELKFYHFEADLAGKEKLNVAETQTHKSTKI